jgi:hypothetical protein
MINELIKNRTQSGEMTETEKVLGDLSRVYRVADFWDINADLIELIAVNELLEYAQTGEFTREEFANFRKGLYCIGIFMAKCADDRKKIEELKIAGKSFKEDVFQ